MYLASATRLPPLVDERERIKARGRAPSWVLLGGMTADDEVPPQVHCHGILRGCIGVRPKGEIRSHESVRAVAFQPSEFGRQTAELRCQLKSCGESKRSGRVKPR